MPEITSKPGSAFPPRLFSLRDSAFSGPGKSPSAAKAFYFSCTNTNNLREGGQDSELHNVNVYMVILHCTQMLQNPLHLPGAHLVFQAAPRFSKLFIIFFPAPFFNHQNWKSGNGSTWSNLHLGENPEFSQGWVFLLHEEQEVNCPRQNPGSAVTHPTELAKERRKSGNTNS